MRLIFLSPVNTPFCSKNEHDIECDKENPLRGIYRKSLSDSIFDPIRIQWNYGYGSIENDNIPIFFQPVEASEINLTTSESHEIESILLTYGLIVEKIRIELYSFNENIGIILANIECKPNEAITLKSAKHNIDFDKAATQICETIYKDKITPALHEISNKNSSFSFHPKFLWTARYAFLDEENDKNSLITFKDWVSPNRNIETRNYLGLGNNLSIRSSLSEYGCTDTIRVALLCQFFNAILENQSTQLKKTYKRLQEIEKRPLKDHKKTKVIIDNIIAKSDHLEFIKSEFQEAKRGTQGSRRAILDEVITKWDLRELQNNCLSRASNINKKANRIIEAQRHKTNKSIEFILTTIGGVAIIDLSVSLVTSSRNIKQDNIPGILDAFNWMPPDGSISASLAIVALSSIYVSSKRKD